MLQQTGSQHSTNGWSWKNVILAAVGFLTIGALLFPSAGWDDAYMTYWAAYTVADFGAILNYNGQPVEQSSSLGFVLIIALVRWITGIDASIVGRLVSIVFGAATIFAVARLGRSFGDTVGRFAPALVASSTYFVYWSFGGMEATLAALSGVLLLLVYVNVLDEGATKVKYAVAAILGFVYILSRPESIFILAATLFGLGGVLALRRLLGLGPQAWEEKAPRKVLTFILLAAASFGAVATFRLWYFDRIFPQPVYAKSQSLSDGFSQGIKYLLESIQSDFLLIVLLGFAAAALFLLPRAASSMRSSVSVMCALFFFASVGFIVLAGGDGMHGGRFFVPVIPIAVILSVALLSGALPPKIFRVATIGWVVLQVGGALVFARTQSHSDPLWAVAGVDGGGQGDRFHWFERANHDHRRYFSAVIELEKQIDRIRVKKRPVSIFSGQSGFVMYHVAMTHQGEVRYFDRFALVTRDFLECPISAMASRSSWGLITLVGGYLRRIDEIQRQCGIAPPDIIYELFWGSFPPRLDQTLMGAGYRVVFLQDGEVADGSRLFPGNMNVGRVYIAALQDRRSDDVR